MAYYGQVHPSTRSSSNFENVPALYKELFCLKGFWVVPKIAFFLEKNRFFIKAAGKLLYIFILILLFRLLDALYAAAFDEWLQSCFSRSLIMAYYGQVHFFALGFLVIWAVAVIKSFQKRPLCVYSRRYISRNVTLINFRTFVIVLRNSFPSFWS